MSSYQTLLKLHLKLMCRGDRMLYLYLASLITYVILKLYSFELVSGIFLVTCNVYLALLYGHDGRIKVFYQVLNVSEFKIHATKVLLIYLLSLLELISISALSDTKFQPVAFIAHFLTFYTAVLFFNYPNWAKLGATIVTFIAVDLLLSLFSPLIFTILIFLADTFFLFTTLNEQSGIKKTHSL